MTAEVVWWDERLGRGVAKGTWPLGVGYVTLLRSEFLSERIRQGRQRAGLAAGDAVSFRAIGAGRIARRISRSQYTVDQDVATVAAPPTPPPLVTTRLTIRRQSEDEAHYRGEDPEEEP